MAIVMNHPVLRAAHLSAQARAFGVPGQQFALAKLESLAELAEAKRWPQPPGLHLWLFVREGRLRLWPGPDAAALQLEAPGCGLADAATPLSLQADGPTPPKGWLLLMNTAFLQEWEPITLATVPGSSGCNIHALATHADEVFRVLDLLEEVYVQPQYMKRTESLHIFKVMLSNFVQLEQGYAQHGSQQLPEDWAPARENDPLKGFLNLLENTEALRLVNMDDLAERLGTDARKLNSLCKQRFGTTAYGLYKERLAQRATRMLQDTDLSVNDIALQLNFANDTGFIRFYKQQTGFSPLKHRLHSRLGGHSF